MPDILANGVRLHFELDGSGEPVVLVHGSWLDLHSWEPLVPPLAGALRVIRYDRRGHGRSERFPAPGSAREDAADLAGLIEALELGPAHLVGGSFGGSVCLRLAAERPELVRTIAVHEPPLFGLLRDDPVAAAVYAEVERRSAAVLARIEDGDDEGAARLFVDTIAFGPGTWERDFRRGLRRMFVRNAQTFLDECRDPECVELDLERLGAFAQPALVSSGAASGVYFRRVADRVAEALPFARRVDVAGTGHAPQRDVPGAYAELLLAHARRRAPQLV